MRKLKRHSVPLLVIGFIIGIGLVPSLLFRPTVALEPLAPSPQAGELLELAVPYWEVGGGFDSTVLINNTRQTAIELHPYLVTANGRRTEGHAITVPGNGSLDVPVRDIAPVRNGHGQLGFTYRGAALEINAQIVIANRARSIAWNHPFEAKNEFSSSSFEGVFYVPKPSTKTEIALSNTSERVVTVTFAFRDERSSSGRDLDETIDLRPRETEVVNVRRFLGNGFSAPGAARVSIRHTGAAGDVRLHGMISDPDGFSSNMRFLEPAAMTGSKLFSPVLPLRERISPIVILSNANTRNINVNVEAYYMLNGTPGEQTIHSVSLVSGGVTHVNLLAQMETLPDGATNIGLALSYYAHGGGLLADVLLVDDSGSGVYQVTPKGYAMDQHPAHSFPFRIDGNLETVVTVANPSDDKAIAFSLFVLYDGKSYTYTHTGGNVLKPGEVRYVDIKALRDQQTPGLLGKPIPRSVSTGQIKVMFHVKGTPQNHSGHAGHGGYGAGKGVGASSVIVYDTVEKISFASCAQPPPPHAPDCLLVDVFGDDSGFDCDSPPDDYRVDILPEEPTDFKLYFGWNGWGVDALTETILEDHEATLQEFSYNDNYFEVEEGVPVSVVTAIGPGEHELTVTVELAEGEVQRQVQVRIPACNLSINADSLSPIDGTLPQRNPAKIINTNSFNSEFIVSRSEPVCPIQWSIDSGGSSYAHIVSASDDVVTVNGDSVGTFVLRATTFWGITVSVSVPVVNMQTVDVKVWIVKDDNGNNPVTDQARVNNDIAGANEIWVQCGIQFNLLSTGAIHSTAVIVANATERDLLRSWNANHVNTGALEIVYVDAFASPDDGYTGEANDDGIVINNGGNFRTAAHELGHAMGLPNGGDVDVQLMHGDFSTTKADITKIECNALTKFTSD